MEASKRLLAISVKKTERAAKLRSDADELDVEASDLRAAAWSLDPSTDPRPALDASFNESLERLDRVSARSRELQAQGLDRVSADARAMLDCP